ncbi:hypothetical protein BJY52DRAFT_1271525 [Lactarius psammicola]|nr:hypothetical protein BJY52DRAFT_1271525 [Lactarius psammicola]
MSSKLSNSWLPGGDFVDVFDTFLDAAQDMELGDVIFSEGFYALRRYERSQSNEDAFSPSSLVNAGSVQIGDPRMDSGLILDDEAERLVFSSLTSPLPEV